MLSIFETFPTSKMYLVIHELIYQFLEILHTGLSVIHSFANLRNHTFSRTVATNEPHGCHGHWSQYFIPASLLPCRGILAEFRHLIVPEVISSALPLLGRSGFTQTQRVTIYPSLKPSWSRPPNNPAQDNRYPILPAVILVSVPPCSELDARISALSLSLGRT